MVLLSLSDSVLCLVLIPVVPDVLYITNQMTNFK